MLLAVGVTSALACTACSYQQPTAGSGRPSPASRHAARTPAAKRSPRPGRSAPAPRSRARSADSRSPAPSAGPSSPAPSTSRSPAPSTSPSSPTSAASPGSPDPTKSTSAPTGDSSASSLIPSSGAYLGAYVQPAQYTAAAEIAAVNSFDKSVGGSIGIVHVYHPWESSFPNAADQYFVRSGKVLLLTWSGTPDTKRIIAGDYDALIRTRAEAVKHLGRPILMEFRHEMDRPNLQWAVHGPADYIAAWDHIRSIFASVGATNVGWVWCPTGYGFQVGRAQAFYPGNNEVDWVCADIYSPSPAQSLAEVAQPFLSWAKHTHKPVLIGEFAVGGDLTGRPRWLTKAGELAKTDTQIKGMLYFDANGTDSNGHPFQYWLGSDKPALAAFARLLTWRVFQPAFAPGS
jgi:Glycosyl hydrolase family 26